jgi:hypothetical protein
MLIRSAPCYLLNTGRLVFLPLPRLLPLLSILLSLVTLNTILPPPSLNLSTEDARDQESHPVVDPGPIKDSLSRDHGVEGPVFDGVQELFGRTVRNPGGEEQMIWLVDVKRIVREMGKGMLMEENVSDLLA